MKNILVGIIFLFFAWSVNAAQISGVLYDHNGKPIEGHVSIKHHSYGEIESTATQKDGAFKLKLEAGYWNLVFSAPLMEPYIQKVFIEKNRALKVDAYLVPIQYDDSKTEVRLNYVNVDGSNRGKIFLKRNEQGFWKGVIPSSASKRKVSIKASTKNRVVQLPYSSEWLINGFGYYDSILKPSDKPIKLSFKFPSHAQSSISSRVEVNEQEYQSQLAVWDTMNEYLNHRHTVTPENEQRYIDQMQTFYKDTSNPTVKKVALLGNLVANHPDYKLAQKAFNTIAFDSYAWEQFMRFIFANGVFHLEECDKNKHDKEFKYKAFKNNEALVKSFLSQAQLPIYRSAVNQYIVYYLPNDFQSAQNAFEKWERREPEDSMMLRLKAMHFSDKNIDSGKPVPKFHFKDLQGNTVSDDSLKGSVYLIDLWGTWCGPCIHEMPFLHSAYKKYKSEGFKIVSLNFHDDAPTLREFRSSKFPMPWTHVMIKHEQSESVMRLFETAALPMAVLVDKNGVIIDIRKNLLGEDLDKVLSKVFSK